MTVTSLIANPSLALPEPTGTTITWTASTTGGTAGSATPTQFKFLRLNNATAAWTVVQDYSSSNTFTWMPLPGEEGSYALEVWVKNAGSTAARDAFMTSSTFTITASSIPPLTITSLISSPTLPQSAGSTITWTASTTGGAAPLQFRFLRFSYDSGAWTMVQDYSTSNTYTWTPLPAEAGSYAIQVWVKNANSTATWDVFETGLPFKITP